MSDWRPVAGMEVLRQRAEMLAAIRAFFAERGVMEVETPLLSAHGASDPHLDSFCTQYLGPGSPDGRSLFLQTSPEFAMKRLLAADSGPIYQISKSFRNGEAGRFHNPEFTMLEWYRPGMDYHSLMTEVDALLQQVLNSPPALRASYGELFARHLDLDAHGATVTELRDCAASHGVHAPEALGDDVDAWQALLWSHVVEPRLGDGGRPQFVFDYPAGQAMLARVRRESPPVAERFEVYVNGVELANGFQELEDGVEQARRFAENNRRRRDSGLEVMAADQRLLEALVHGLPSCSGVALGVDRLLMLQTGAPTLADVLTFPIENT